MPIGHGELLLESLDGIIRGRCSCAQVDLDIKPGDGPDSEDEAPMEQ